MKQKGECQLKTRYNKWSNLFHTKISDNHGILNRSYLFEPVYKQTAEFCNKYPR